MSCFVCDCPHNGTFQNIDSKTANTLVRMNRTEAEELETVVGNAICPDCLELCEEYEALQNKMSAIANKLNRNNKTVEIIPENPEEEDEEVEEQLLDSSLDPEIDVNVLVEDEDELKFSLLIENEEFEEVEHIEEILEDHELETPSSERNLNDIYALKNKMFICLLCSSENSADVELNSADFSKHMQLEHDMKLLFCDECGVVFLEIHELQQHKLDKCGKRKHESESKTELLPTAKRIDLNSWQCLLCKKFFSTRKLLDHHMHIHMGQQPYKCPHCDKLFANKYTYSSHLKTHDERPRPFQCDECDKTFLTVQNLRQHKRTHYAVKMFICDICEKGFNSEKNLSVHKIVHSKHKPFMCRVCGKAFARRGEVKDHERIHTGERPFTCDICQATFTQQSNMLSHKRTTHLNDKRHKCDQCGKGFKRRRLLDYHVKSIHTGERPLKCPECPSAFVYPEHLKKHLQIHQNTKQFSCEVCNKSFNSRDNRNAHRYTHSEKKPYECRTCGQGFMRKHQLYTHIKQKQHNSGTIIINKPQICEIKLKRAAIETVGKPGAKSVAIESDDSIAVDWSKHLKGKAATYFLEEDEDDPECIEDVEEMNPIGVENEIYIMDENEDEVQNHLDTILSHNED